jgi:hypothetical protein
MDNFKYLQHVPRIPLQLSKYDLTGVKVDPNYKPSKSFTVINPPDIYYPNINGNISFIIYHTLYLNPATRNIKRLCYVAECDLKNGHLFILTIPFNMFTHFVSEYQKNHANGPPCFIDITVNDIFTYPIYSMNSFGKLSKYQRDLTFLREAFPFLDLYNINILPYIKQRNDIFHQIKYYVGGGEIFHRIERGNIRLVKFDNRRYGFTKNMHYKLENNSTSWKGSMNSLEPWTYSNSKEQLKIIWNSRKLELFDF